MSDTARDVQAKWQIFAQTSVTIVALTFTHLLETTTVILNRICSLCIPGIYYCSLQPLSS